MKKKRISALVVIALFSALMSIGVTATPAAAGAGKHTVKTFSSGCTVYITLNTSSVDATFSNCGNTNIDVRVCGQSKGVDDCYVWANATINGSRTFPNSTSFAPKNGRVRWYSNVYHACYPDCDGFYEAHGNGCTWAHEVLRYDAPYLASYNANYTLQCVTGYIYCAGKWVPGCYTPNDRVVRLTEDADSRWGETRPYPWVLRHEACHAYLNHTSSTPNPETEANNCAWASAS